MTSLRSLQSCLYFLEHDSFLSFCCEQDCLIVDLDAVNTLPENQVQAVLMWNTYAMHALCMTQPLVSVLSSCSHRRPDSVGKVVKRKQFYDVEIGKLKTKHRHLHRAVFVLAILSELIFVANFMCPAFCRAHLPPH